ncbi:MAG TPA: prepilin peptidase [Verrucomicrobiae bacterium]|nr:prepilin peptidase [Verrucomicrobiae bacterium]
MNEVWEAVPFHFWSVMIFVLGCAIGSFLNVCIYRMPIGLSIVSPPSHCPNCKYSIPWHFNVPLVTWLALGGKCSNCKTPISPRYFAVELITGLAFLGSWLAVGRHAPLLALAYCLILGGFIVAAFIDFEHFIIPDEITKGGMVVGFLCSVAVPALHKVDTRILSMKESILGMLVGAGIVYFILRVGKILFGKQQLQLQPDTRIVFTDTALVLPERSIPYEDLFYRKTDVITFEAKVVELIDRCYKTVRIRLSPEKLEIGDESLDPEQVPHLEAVTDQMVLPREAMGLGDVKFMAAIGAFLGWKATLFSLMVSSIIGAVVGLGLILLRRQEWSSKLPYGPYIALAAIIWMFGGDKWLALLLEPRLPY